MDGLEAARHIRALGRVPGRGWLAELPIVTMTALAMAQGAENSQAAGMSDHVTKLIDPERLGATLKRWLKRPEGRSAEPALPASCALPADQVIALIPKLEPGSCGPQPRVPIPVRRTRRPYPQDKELAWNVCPRPRWP